MATLLPRKEYTEKKSYTYGTCDEYLAIQHWTCAPQTEFLNISIYLYSIYLFHLKIYFWKEKKNVHFNKLTKATHAIDTEDCKE